ncbi:hypothetical protein CKAN_01522200 [Cinnamomum micranthum f. kanehirae]|uniref:Uncharacterized protein n=1 Tax=Cinnamomum micranthum f. kanehirae TaxID=337451 RepID=A0A3S3N6I7_9MAGN|nr:hypothetical protein CKAN_01522200 [Cinnamomum micranthum f. kanehirae]
MFDCGMHIGISRSSTLPRFLPNLRIRRF